MLEIHYYLNPRTKHSNLGIHAPHAISAKTLLAHWFREKRSTLFEVVLGNNALPIEEPMHKAIKSIPVIDDEAVCMRVNTLDCSSPVCLTGEDKLCSFGSSERFVFV